MNLWNLENLQNLTFFIIKFALLPNNYKIDSIVLKSFGDKLNRSIYTRRKFINLLCFRGSCIFGQLYYLNAVWEIRENIEKFAVLLVYFKLNIGILMFIVI